METQCAAARTGLFGRAAAAPRRLILWRVDRRHGQLVRRRVQRQLQPADVAAVADARPRAVVVAGVLDRQLTRGAAPSHRCLGSPNPTTKAVRECLPDNTFGALRVRRSAARDSSMSVWMQTLRFARLSVMRSSNALSSARCVSELDAHIARMRRLAENSGALACRTLQDACRDQNR